jgi:hypothetical protein
LMVGSLIGTVARGEASMSAVNGIIEA